METAKLVLCLFTGITELKSTIFVSSHHASCHFVFGDDADSSLQQYYHTQQNVLKYLHLAHPLVTMNSNV
jgi:hypothetical protein